MVLWGSGLSGFRGRKGESGNLFSVVVCTGSLGLRVDWV